MLQSSFQLHGAGLLMKRPWRTIGWLEAMRRCVESHVEEGHTVSRERRGFPFMAATSSSDSARRSLSSERTRDLVSYDLLFTPCHPEIRDKFDMGYSQWEFFVDLCVNFLVRPTRISPRQSVRGRRAVRAPCRRACSK